MNLILGILEMVVCFSLCVLFHKKWGKEGLFVWVALASVLANLQVSKQIDLIGLKITLGNVLFASTFLATDMLNEFHSFKDSKKAVYIGLTSVIVFVLVTQLSVLFTPNELDMVQGSFENIFSLVPRICLSSVVMFFLSNLADVYLFDWLKKKFPKHLWIRNNVSTIVCNCMENFLFTFGAFAFIYPITDCLTIALGTSIVEILIGLCDTPFLYLAKYLNNRKEKRNEN